MPEAPEVYILAAAANAKYGGGYVANGKQLFTPREIWSFGLTGTVALDGDGNLIKVASGQVYGAVKPRAPTEEEDEEGLSKEGSCRWLTASEDELRATLHRWTTMRRRLDLLLLDQTEVAGIGVVWGSEIVAEAGIELSLQLKASQQPAAMLAHLLPAMLSVRQRAMATYGAFLQEELAEGRLDAFLERWFKNLYAVRDMQVYKIGQPMPLGGRTWWV